MCHGEAHQREVAGCMYIELNAMLSGKKKRHEVLLKYMNTKYEF